MDDFSLNFDLDVSQLSAVDLPRLGVTVAQVRTIWSAPLVAIPPVKNSRLPDVFQVFGFATSHRFLFVALTYDESSRKFTALAVRVADRVSEIQRFICVADVS